MNIFCYFLCILSENLKLSTEVYADGDHDIALAIPHIPPNFTAIVKSSVRLSMITVNQNNH